MTQVRTELDDDIYITVEYPYGADRDFIWSAGVEGTDIRASGFATSYNRAQQEARAAIKLWTDDVL